MRRLDSWAYERELEDACLAKFTMQIPILLGREIDERDGPNTASVAVVSDLFAKAYLGTGNPIGRRITLAGPAPPVARVSRDREIIGVAATARYGGLKEDVPPVVYIPYAQITFPPLAQMTYAVRTGDDPLAYVSAVRATVRGLDALVPVTNVRTQAAEIDQTINQEIVFARLCTAFALLALVIACVGLCGTLAYATLAAPAKSASAWRSARDDARSSGWCCATSVSSLPRGWRSACRSCSPHRAWSSRFSFRSSRMTPLRLRRRLVCS